jgi:hypothetical protein
MELAQCWRVREEARKPTLKDCRSSPSEVCSLRLDEPVSEAVNRETALCEERSVGFQTAHARPVRLQIRSLSSGSLLCVFPRVRWVGGETAVLGANFG